MCLTLFAAQLKIFLLGYLQHVSKKLLQNFFHKKQKHFRKLFSKNIFCFSHWILRKSHAANSYVAFSFFMNALFQRNRQLKKFFCKAQSFFLNKFSDTFFKEFFFLKEIILAVTCFKYNKRFTWSKRTTIASVLCDLWRYLRRSKQSSSNLQHKCVNATVACFKKHWAVLIPRLL